MMNGKDSFDIVSWLKQKIEQAEKEFKSAKTDMDKLCWFEDLRYLRKDLKREERAMKNG